MSVCVQDVRGLAKRGTSLGGAVAAALMVRALRRHFGSTDGPVLQMRERVGISAAVNLRGELLPVAGLREKLRAARRAHCRLVVLASANAREVEALCDRLEGHGGDEGVSDVGLAAWIREHVKLADDVVDLLCLSVEGACRPWSTSRRPASPHSQPC